MRNQFLLGNALRFLMKEKKIEGEGTELAKAMADSGMEIGSIESASRVINNHLANKTKLERLWLERYCDFFHCSADYLLGRISKPTHPITDISKEIGLSTDAIVFLRNINKLKENEWNEPATENKKIIKCLNILLEEEKKIRTNPKKWKVASIFNEIYGYIYDSNLIAEKELIDINRNGTYVSQRDLFKQYELNQIRDYLEWITKKTQPTE